MNEKTEPAEKGEKIEYKLNNKNTHQIKKYK